MATNPLGFLQNIIQTGENDVSGAAQKVLDYLNQPKQRVKEQPIQAPTRTKQNGAVSDAVSGYLQSSTGSPSQMGAVDQNSSPGKQFGQAMAAPIDPAADATNMIAGGIHSTLPFLVGGVKAADQGASFLDRILGRGKQAATNATPTAADFANNTMRIVLDPSYYGADREKEVQQTVDNIVPGSTALEKYTNLKPTMDQLGNQITRIMQMNPKSTSLDQLVSDFDKNLEANGIYRTAENAKDTVQKTADGYIKDLFHVAGGNGSAVNPTEITDTALHDMKQSVNQDSQSIFKKIAKGTSLSDKDKVILQARQTLDDAMTTLHPEIKDLTTMQSHLFDAAGSLFKGREQEIKNAAASAGKGISTRGLLTTLGIGVPAATALGAGIYGASLQFSQPKTYSITGGNISLPALTQLKDPNGNPISASNIANYSSQVSAIDQQEAALQSQLQSYNPSVVKEANAKMGQLEAQRDAIKTKYGAVAPIMDQYIKTDQQNNGLVQAKQLLKNANPQWFQAYSALGPFAKVLRETVPGYGQFAEQLNTLKQKYGIDPNIILDATNPQTANAAIDQAISANVNQLKTQVQDSGFSWGSGNPQQPTQHPAPQTTNQQTVPAPSAAPAPTDVPSANQGQTIDQSLYKFIPPNMLNQVQNGGQGGGYTSSDLLNSILQKAIV